ncbi:winged helix-turn-helix transcriptional regulator [Pseudonocardia sp. CA-107938]|uniref:winged helix-turn-helix transcriptional regulator n=1 Tax=Pseudonocardia sp. CA-107938 TaxID=3240021 RepID=UPI003D8D70EB
MAGRRKYGEGCAVTHALDLIGERWALVIVRELLLGPKRFSDLRAGIPGASADMLSTRLRELHEAGVVVQRRLPPPAASQVYELTSWGAELDQVITDLGRWGSRSPTLEHDADTSVDSVMLSLRAMFDPATAAGWAATIALVVDGRPFRVEIADAELRLSAGPTDEPTVTIATDRGTLVALLYSGRALADAVRDGTVLVDGPSAVAEHFLRLFPLPEPA